jgi:hypothetical protein
MKQTVIDIALEQIYQAIVKSKNPDALTKRTGEYRIGLRKAMEILSDLKEMEKEQIIATYKEGHYHLEFDSFNPQRYYNETFKTSEK